MSMAMLSELIPNLHNLSRYKSNDRKQRREPVDGDFMALSSSRGTIIVLCIIASVFTIGNAGLDVGFIRVQWQDHITG